MSGTIDRREFVHVAMVKEGDDDWRAAFVIDGRRYETEEAVKSELDEAYDFLHANRIPAEFEVRRPSDTDPDLQLPSWPEYKSRTARS